MSWHSQGTVLAANGSTAIVGTGTGWFGALQNGWGFVGPDGRVYEIATITDATNLVLTTPYQGAGAPAQSYAAFPTAGTDVGLVVALQDLIGKYQSIYDGPGQGKFTGDVVAIADQDTGISWPAANQVALKAGGVDVLTAFNDRVEALALEGTPIGATTRSSGAFTSIEASGNAIIGTSSPWTFAGSWRGVKITDRHGIQATNSASSISISSNANIGASGWEYTVSGVSAGSYNISGNLHIWSQAAIGADGDAVTWSEAMRLDGNAGLLPGTDDAQNIGSGSKRWDDIYATNTTIQSSDARLKSGIRDFSEAERRVAASLRGGARIYQWTDAVERKGEEVARLHCGFIAQDVEAAFAAEGLDVGRYSLFTRTPITKTVTKTREVEQQKTEFVTQIGVVVDVSGGRAFQRTVTKTIEQPMWQDVPLHDEAGVVIGNHQMPVMETVIEEFEVEEPDGDRLGLRYAELMCLLMAPAPNGVVVGAAEF